MSVTVQQILGLLQTLAPSELACSWDNVGLLVDVGVPVSHVLTHTGHHGGGGAGGSGERLPADRQPPPGDL